MMETSFLTTRARAAQPVTTRKRTRLKAPPPKMPIEAQGHEETGKGRDGVGQPHDGDLDRSALETGQGAEGHGQDGIERRDDQGQSDRGPGPAEQPAEKVAAQGVRPHDMPPIGWPEGGRVISLVGRTGGQDRPQHGQEEEGGHKGKSYQSARPPVRRSPHMSHHLIPETAPRRSMSRTSQSAPRLTVMTAVPRKRM